MECNLIVLKSRAFALQVVRAYQRLEQSGERILSRQFIRSGTSIGANVAEGQYAQSKADFLSKYTIALKEASETLYWLELLFEAGYLTDSDDVESLMSNCEELVRLLAASVKKLKGIEKDK